MDEGRETGQPAGRKAAIRAGMALAVFVGLVLFVFVAGPDARYAWLKAFHVIAVIAWMAGMLYLPRLFVYHADAVQGAAGGADDSEPSATFKVMERRLMKVIMTPAMIITWGLGLWLATIAGYWSAPWFHVKLLAVVGMTAMHFYLAASVKRFVSGSNRIASGRWRLLNEVPTVLMFVAVIVVFVRPFT